jgi:hypothetical protein
MRSLIRLLSVAIFCCLLILGCAKRVIIPEGNEYYNLDLISINENDELEIVLSIKEMNSFMHKDNITLVYVPGVPPRVYASWYYEHNIDVTSNEVKVLISPTRIKKIKMDVGSSQFTLSFYLVEQVENFNKERISNVVNIDLK